jgi:hypothetical protein
MKLRYEHIKSTCAIGAMLIFLITVHTLAVYIFAVRNVVTHVDPLASSEGITALKGYLEDPKRYQQESTTRLAHNMQKTFAYIQSITIAQTPDHTIRAQINLHKPWIELVQQDQILMQNASAMPKKYLDGSYLRGITQLDTTLADPETAEVSSQLITALQEIDQEIIAHSYITCNHLHEIRIHMKRDNMELVCNRTSLPDKKIVDQCKKIKHELETVDRYPDGICADVRFCNQIIISKLQARR